MTLPPLMHSVDTIPDGDGNGNEQFDTPAKLEETAKELTRQGIRVRDYAYPSKTTPAPYANTPAPPMEPGKYKPAAVYFDPRVAFADYEFRIHRDTKLAIDGQKARWLLDMGWLTKQHQSSWREKDWEAVRDYDAFVELRRENGMPTVTFVIPRKYRAWKGPGPPPSNLGYQDEAGEKHKSCIIA